MMWLLASPWRMIGIGILMALLGVVLPLLMIAQILESTFFLNFLAFFMSLIGTIMGFVGMVFWVKIKRNQD